MPSNERNPSQNAEKSVGLYGKSDHEASYPERVIKISKEHANKVIGFLQQHNAIENHFKIQREGDYVLIPLANSLNPEQIGHISSLDAASQMLDNPTNRFNFIPRNPSRKSVRAELSKSLPGPLRKLVPRSFDIIGQIAIVELNRQELAPLRPYVRQIGEALLSQHKNVRTVFEKAGDVSGEYRLRDLKYVCGQNDSKTLYQENGCRFRLDIKQTFFTPRLAFERNRIASIQSDFDNHGWIWDMFCGIGPYFIQIAKQRPQSKILATDINPACITFARQNIKLNKIANKVECFQQDVSKVPHDPKFSPYLAQVSRVVMNLPEKNFAFLPILPPYLHPSGCLLHIYYFAEKDKSYHQMEQEFRDHLRASGLVLKNIMGIRSVKPFSPALDTIGIDAVILPL